MQNEIRPTSEGKWPEIPLNTLVYLSVGDATAWNVGLFKTTALKCLVVIERKGAFNFTAPDWLHWAYVAEKLNMLEGDARNIADFLNSQPIFNWREKKDVTQGFYRKLFCSDYVDPEHVEKNEEDEVEF